MKSVLAISVIFATCAFGQRAFNPADPHDEFKPSVKGMAQRLAASDYVVVGTVLKIDIPFTRALRQETYIFSTAIFSTAIRLESTLCRKSNFSPGSAPANLPSEIYLFTTLAVVLDAGYRDEILRPGHRYLFSLTSAADLESKLKKFDLDPQQRYFEILGHSDGAVELPTDADKGKRFTPAGYKSDRDLATPILKAATALCAAVQPPNLSKKLAALQRLKSSRDLAMRENADTVINLLGSR